MVHDDSGDLTLRPVGWHRGPFRQKLGIPRQPGLHGADSRIELDAARVGPESVRGLEEVSHLWLSFGFSRHDPAKARDLVRPPRLGGQTQLGVFATRSPYRHNGLGLSLVELIAVDFPTLTVRGADLLDGTPIYDIKPYLPWVESKPEARCAWAGGAPPRVALELSDAANEKLAQVDPEGTLRQLLHDCLVVDPRPAYDPEASPRSYRTRIGPADVEFRVEADKLVVLDLQLDAQG